MDSFRSSKYSILIAGHAVGSYAGELDLCFKAHLNVNAAFFLQYYCANFVTTLLSCGRFS